MTETLDDLDELIESQEVVIESPVQIKRNHAIRDMIVNVDVARRLAEGESPRDLAVELGVTEATIRRWMHKAPMIDLMAIETRRILRHLPKRKLSKVSYKNLAETAIKMLDLQERVKNGSMGEENRVINQTVIDQINVLVYGRSNEGKSEKHISSVSDLETNDIPELPEEPEKE